MRVLSWFEGRIGRGAFLARWIAIFAGMVLPAAILASKLDALWAQILVISALGLPFLWIFFGLQVRRLHDLDRPAWWVAIPWSATLIAGLIEYSSGVPAGESPKSKLLLLPGWLYLLFAPGKSKPNRHGPPPA